MKFYQKYNTFKVEFVKNFSIWVITSDNMKGQVSSDGKVSDTSIRPGTLTGWEQIGCPTLVFTVYSEGPVS